MKFHCFATHFTSISCSSETTKGRWVKVNSFLKALFKTNSEINVLRLWLWPYLKYSSPKITTSQHMRRNQYSLFIKWMFSFTLRQRRLKISLHAFQIELNLVDTFLYMPWFTSCYQLNTTYGFSWFNSNNSSTSKDMKNLSTK